jgi:RHS repeat-associated protein
VYDYDDLGRTKTKRLDPTYTGNGGSELESLNYSFNIHNQLTGINKDYALKNPGNYSKWGHFFGMYLGFDNRDNVFNHAQLNGQVTGVLWNTQGDDAQRKYDYTYDNAGRLTNADFTEQQHPGDGWANNKMDFSVGGYTGKITYDLNGNLLSMLQKGVLPGTTAPITIDDLRYTYSSFSNKLQSVTDQMTTTNANGTFGDFKDGSNGSSPDYIYDNNGNVVIDLNKNAKDLNNVVGANGIHYNFLDKPDQIRIAGKGTINIVYSSDGEKLQRTFTPETGTATTTTYINQFVYQAMGTGADVLSYINFEEGRLRVVTPTSQNNGYDQLTVDGNMDLPNSKRGAYDYFILDYQQNVRMILSEETHVAGNTATMETSRASAEDPIFGQTGAANEVETTRYNTPSGWTGNTTASVSRLGNIVAHNIGPNTLQKVMAGDIVNANVQYYYSQPASNYNPNYVSNVLNSLLQAITNGPTSSLVKGSASNVTNQLGVNTGFVSAVQPSTNTGTTPLAYLTILFFDERFNFISATVGGAWQQLVASSVGSNGASLYNQSPIKAPKNGYVYVYVSNQSDQDVYFDNLAVTISQGNIIEENHYYSFGLKIAAISSKKYADSYDGAINNPFQYNGKEMLDDDADLNWYDYGFRNYDPQIGRFTQLDPLTDYYPFLTPYQYASNDPITNIDIDGLEGGDAVKAGFNVAGVGASLMDNATEFGKTFHLTFSGFKTATGGASKVARHVINKTATIFGKATQAANALAKTEAPNQVGRYVRITPQERAALYPWLNNNSEAFPGTSDPSSNNWGSFANSRNQVVNRTGNSSHNQPTKSPREGNQSSFNIDKAISTLNSKAHDKSQHKCAYFVRIALAAGGINTNSHPVNAKDYGPYLRRWGFNHVDATDYNAQRGDIRVFQPYPAGNPAGHIDMFNGKNWVSDFIEKGQWPGRGYAQFQNFEIFRWSTNLP